MTTHETRPKAQRAPAGQHLVGSIPHTSLDLGGPAAVSGLSMPSGVWDFIRQDAARRGLSMSRLILLLILRYREDEEEEAAARAAAEMAGGGRVSEG